MDLSKVLNILGLQKDSSESSIEQAIQNVISERNKAQNELKTLKDEKGKLETQLQELKDEQEKQREERIKNMLDQAISDKKITEKQREKYEKLAEADLESTEAILNEMPKPQSLTSLTGGQGAGNGLTEEQKKWSFIDWQRKDPKGLQQMKDENKELYKELYKKQFGKEPQDA